MATTPLDQCHQCKRSLQGCQHPWTFHARLSTGELDDVVRFCAINCIAAYYKLAPAASLAPVNGQSNAPKP